MKADLPHWISHYEPKGKFDDILVNGDTFMSSLGDGGKFNKGEINMAVINKGLALVSVADVMFFNPVTDAYMGEGLALTNSTITQEVQSIEQRGGYLNALLFDIKHSKISLLN